MRKGENSAKNHQQEKNAYRLTQRYISEMEISHFINLSYCCCTEIDACCLAILIPRVIVVVDTHTFALWLPVFSYSSR